MSENTTNKETNNRTKKVIAGPDFKGLGTFIKEQNEMFRESRASEMKAYSESSDKVIKAEERLGEKLREVQTKELENYAKLYEEKLSTQRDKLEDKLAHQRQKLENEYDTQLKTQKQELTWKLETQREQHKTELAERDRKQELDELHWKRSAGVWGILVTAIMAVGWNIVFMVEYVANNIVN